MNKSKIKSDLAEIFDINQIKTNHKNLICVPCPICNCSGYKLCLNHETNKVYCSSCFFDAKPIELFIDAYRNKPNGNLIEIEEIEIIRRKTL